MTVVINMYKPYLWL